MNIEIYADFRQKVQINPKDVIEKLIKKEIGGGWIFERKFENEVKFYLGYEQSAGCHSFDVEEEITEERYSYVKALQLVLKKIK